MTRVFDDDLDAGFGTRAIHAGQRPDPLAGAIMTPIYLTSTYVQDGLGENKGYEYARGKNPTREALERNVAALEGGRHGFAFASGMGCLDSIMKLFRVRRPHRLRRERLRRHVPPVRSHPPALRAAVHLRRHARPAADRRRDDAGHARDPRRDADQSADADHRPRARSREIAHDGRRVAHRRQHLRVAVSSSARSSSAPTSSTTRRRSI